MTSYNITSQDQSSGIVLQQGSGAQHAPRNNNFYASAQNKSCYAKHADSFWLRLVGFCLVNTFFFFYVNTKDLRNKLCTYCKRKAIHQSRAKILWRVLKSEDVCDVWRLREDTEHSLLFCVVRFNPDYQLCHHIPVIAGIREKIWGGWACSGRTRQTLSTIWDLYVTACRSEKDK